MPEDEWIEIEDNFEELDVADDQDLDQIEQINDLYNQILNGNLELKSQSSFNQQEEAHAAAEKERMIKKSADKKEELRQYFGN